MKMRTAYRCRAYPDPAQQQLLTRTFGCVRLVWNQTLAERRRLWHAEGKSPSYAASDAALTQLKKDPQLAFLSEVPSVPLQQALRHQHQAFQAFYGKRARYPRFKSRRRRHLERRARRLARYQRRLARCQRGSANRTKAAAKVARAHRKVRDGRRDFLHRVTTRLVRSADVIVIEDLNVAGMIRNRHVARAISDCGWGEFRRQLDYKCQRYGRELIVIDRWYPSSKNILAAGLAAARSRPGDACGASVRHPGPPGCSRQ
jgi:putative transposase